MFPKENIVIPVATILILTWVTLSKPKKPVAPPLENQDFPPPPRSFALVTGEGGATGGSASNRPSSGVYS